MELQKVNVLLQYTHSFEFSGVNKLMYNCLFFPVVLDYCASVGLKGTPWIGNQSTISGHSLLLVRVLYDADTTGSGIYRKCVVGGSPMCHQLWDIVTHSESVKTRRGVLPVALQPWCCWIPIIYQTASFKDTVLYISCITALMYCTFYITMEHTTFCLFIVHNFALTARVLISSDYCGSISSLMSIQQANVIIFSSHRHYS